MPTQSGRYKKSETHSREKQTKLLKDKLEPKDIAELMGLKEEPEATKTTLPAVAKKVMDVKKTRGGVIVQQEVSYSYGPKKPILSATIRLSTAMRGKRKHDGLVESAYLFRLELVNASPDLKIEGFQLGPWNGESLNLDRGGMILCEPLWTGFEPVVGEVKGRLLLKDVTRQRVIDIPWKTEAVMPGVEPFSS